MKKRQFLVYPVLKDGHTILHIVCIAKGGGSWFAGGRARRNAPGGSPSVMGSCKLSALYCKTRVLARFNPFNDLCFVKPPSLPGLLGSGGGATRRLCSIPAGKDYIEKSKVLFRHRTRGYIVPIQTSEATSCKIPSNPAAMGTNRPSVPKTSTFPGYFASLDILPWLWSLLAFWRRSTGAVSFIRIICGFQALDMSRYW